MHSKASFKRLKRPLGSRVIGFAKVGSKRVSAIGIGLLLVASGALAQQAAPVPPVIIAVDGVPVHDFTGLPLTADGWTDLHAMIMSEGYSDARIVYVSATGNDSTAQAYNQSSAVLGGQPLNPTGMVAAYRTLAAAYNQLRNGYPDVMLLRRGDSWGSSSVNVNKAGRSNSERLIVAAYGPEAVARPIAFALPTPAASHVVIASMETNISGSGSANYRGANVLVEDIGWRGPAGTWNEVWGPMLDGGPSDGAGGGTMRRNTASWVVFFTGFSSSLSTPSRFEENTISRGNVASTSSNVYFSDAADNIQSIRNVSLWTPRVGFRQRRGGVVRENLIIGKMPQDDMFGGGFDLGENVTWVDNVTMYIRGPSQIQGAHSAYVARNIHTAFLGPENGAIRLVGDYGTAFGGWQGHTVFDGNIAYGTNDAYYYNDFPAAQLAADATVTFRNEFMVNTSSSRILGVLTDARITYENNHYFSNAATGSWFGDRTYNEMIPATGAAFDPTTWPDPDRDIVSYMVSIGASPAPTSVPQAIDWFSDGVPGNPSLAGALANRRGAWDDRFTSIAVVNYIREGFGLSRL